MALDALTPAEAGGGRGHTLWKACNLAVLAPVPLNVEPGRVAWERLFPRADALRRLYGPPAVLAPLPDSFTALPSADAPLPVHFDERGITFPQPGVYRLWTRWGPLRLAVVPPKSPSGGGAAGDAVPLPTLDRGILVDSSGKSRHSPQVPAPPAAPQDSDPLLDRATLLWRWVAGEVAHTADTAWLRAPVPHLLHELVYGSEKMGMYCGDASRLLVALLRFHGISAHQPNLTPRHWVVRLGLGHLLDDPADEGRVPPSGFKAVAEIPPSASEESRTSEDIRSGHGLSAPADPPAVALPPPGVEPPRPGDDEGPAAEAREAAFDGHVVAQAELPTGPCLLDATFGVRLLRGNRCVGATELCALARQGPGAFAGLRLDSLGKTWFDARFDLMPYAPPFRPRPELRGKPLVRDAEHYRRALRDYCDVVRVGNVIVWRRDAAGSKP